MNIGGISPHSPRAEEKRHAGLSKVSTFLASCLIAVVTLFAYLLFASSADELSAQANTRSTDIDTQAFPSSSDRPVSDGSVGPSTSRPVDQPQNTPTPAATARRVIDDTPLLAGFPDIPRDRIVADLMPRAQAGDPVAAYVIAMALDDCFDAFNDSPEESAPTDDDFHKALHASQRQQLSKTLDLCAKIDNVALASRIEWLRRAADAGQIDAMLIYGTVVTKSMSKTDMLRDPQAVIELRERTMRYLHQAIDRGSQSALLSAANRYYFGIMTQRDLVRAAAYQKAYVLLSPHDRAGQSVLQRYTSFLSDDENRRVTVLSGEILDRCCR